LGATIGTSLGLLVGFGPSVAILAALTAVIMLPLLRVFHPPGTALAMCPALLHSGAWFPVDVVAAIYAGHGDLFGTVEPLTQQLAARSSASFD
jgi:hypothetical protein